VHKASLRLVATGGGKTVTSGWQDYTITCDPKVATGLKPAENFKGEAPGKSGSSTQKTQKKK
jgi:hypothetical protein